MKKFAALSLALSLGLSCLGNSVSAIAGNNVPEPVGPDFAQQFNIPTEDRDAGTAAELFQNIIIYKLVFGENGGLTRLFSDFANLVNNMSQSSRKYLGAVILSCPVISGLEKSIPSDIRARMIGNFLSFIYHNTDSIEWNIDANHHKGTVNIHMRRISDDIRQVLSMHSEFIRVRENEISFYF